MKKELTREKTLEKKSLKIIGEVQAEPDCEAETTQLGGMC